MSNSLGVVAREWLVIAVIMLIGGILVLTAVGTLLFLSREKIFNPIFFVVVTIEIVLGALMATASGVIMEQREWGR